MSILSPDLSLEDMNHLFDIIDIDSDGSISYTEFLAATLDPRGIDLTILNEAFNLLDADGKGYINYDDIRRVRRLLIFVTILMGALEPHHIMFCRC